MPTLVIFPPVDAPRLARLRDAAPALTIINAESHDAALAAMPRADAFFGKLTPDLLASASRLKWVQSPTASLEHYLFPELVDHPCTLSNMRGIFSDVIADHVMGLILCFARNLHSYIRRQSDGRWEPVGGEELPKDQPFATGPAFVTPIDAAHIHLADCTLGIVGVGGIGAEVARRAAGFGMRIIGVDPATRSVAGVTDEVWPTSRLPDLLGASDFVVIAAPHTPETKKLFRRQQFRSMKRTAFLINVGRGIIVDLTDLDAALEAGDIAGAALDVCEIEPLPADHPLWRRENVIITPHVAAASPRIAERHLEVLVENVRRFAAGQTPLNIVDKRRWY
jgi:phosphoglycerate dehydrogenase-like enzyme